MPGDSGLEVLVDDDAVVDPQPGASRRGRRGHHADADHDDVGGLDPAVVEHDSSTVSSPRSSRHPSPGAADTVVGVQAAEHPADLVAEHPVERHGRGVDEHDVGAHLTSGGGDLRADPPSADDRDAGRAADGVAETEGVVERCEVGGRRRDRRRARRVAAARRRWRARRCRSASSSPPASSTRLGVRVDARRLVGDELDVVLGVEAVGMDVRRRARPRRAAPPWRAAGARRARSARRRRARCARRSPRRGPPRRPSRRPGWRRR